ncbi:low affinity iron permease family protein [Tessaracoccus flavescens]|uniref:low affinity iron permease family protein n=1 Tax=Tessaracoccus flavescens TaxID=399497 RepID=UPI0019310648|nr:low affinity iron permease family protein [Tessaracoccus flavescens]
MINTSTTIITFLMVFLIQSTQNRDTAAIQTKLDELIRVTADAHNALLDLEELDEEDIARVREPTRSCPGRQGRPTVSATPVPDGSDSAEVERAVLDAQPPTHLVGPDRLVEADQPGEPVHGSAQAAHHLHDPAVQHHHDDPDHDGGAADDQEVRRGSPACRRS